MVLKKVMTEFYAKYEAKQFAALQSNFLLTQRTRTSNGGN